MYTSYISKIQKEEGGIVIINKALKEKTHEALSSVLPVSLIILLLAMTVSPVPLETLLLFLAGAVLLVVGMGLFTLGADMAMMPMGEALGRKLARSKRVSLMAAVFFLVGVLVTVAEPDLTVLATQVPGIPDPVLIWTVAAGVGLFLVVSVVRTVWKVPLRWVLLVLYTGVILLSFFIPRNMLAVAFDAGGVTSGPMTAAFLLPFAMGACEALGGSILLDAFGVVALVAMTPLITIQLMGLGYRRKLRRHAAVLEEGTDEILEYDVSMYLTREVKELG